MSTLVGREHPLGVLATELRRTLTSHGGLVLVTGEAGIGKTRLVSALADQARAEGAVVVAGSGWEPDGAPGYWPWVQVARSLRRAASPAEWDDGRRAAGDELSRLLGEAPAAGLPGPMTVPGAGSGIEVDSRSGGEATFALHDAVTTLLVTVSRRRPVVVLLDDLHWADPASVSLLEFIAGHTWFERLLLVATYRDVEAELPEHPLAPVLAGLARRATRVPLGGLTADEVAEVFAHATGERPEPRTVALLHRRTGGNPFFVEQVASLRVSGRRLDAVTPQLSEALEARLAYVAPAVCEVLTAAAVIGREFDSELLAATVGSSAAELRAVLAEAEAARLVTRLPDDPGAPGAEQYAFVHDLIREARYGTLSESQRRKRHAAVAQVLREWPQPGRRAGLSSLAHHAYLAVPEIAPEEAITHLLAAAEDACERIAAEEVVRHYRRALELVPAEDRYRRATVALELAGFQAAVGDVTAARVSFESVTALARTLGDPELLARAALGWHGLGRPVAVGRSEIELMDEAVAALDGAAGGEPAGRAALTSRVLAAASRARVHAAMEQPESQQLSERALELARESGEPAALGFALLARHDASWQPGNAAERLDLVTEMVAVARRRTGEDQADPELELQALLLRTVALLELGDPAALTAHAAFEAAVERAERRRWHYHAESRRGVFAALTGAFDTARAAFDGSYALAERLGEVDREHQWREQRWSLALLQGDFAEADRLAAGYGDEPRYGELLRAVTAAERGNGQRGEGEPVGRLVPMVLSAAAESPPMFAPTFHRMLAQLAAASGDPAWCRQAREVLAPYRELWLVVAGASLVYGPYAYWLAQVDAAERRWDDAVAGFAAAIRAADRLHARPWSVLARRGLAQALAGRGGPGDRERAADLFTEVAAEAVGLGMRQVPAAAEAALARLGPALPSKSVPPESGQSGAGPVGAAESNEFRFDGRVWILRFAGRTVHLPPAKGLDDLRVLLDRPGAEVAASELLNPAGGREMQAVDRLGADQVLDERAKVEYRRRLDQLAEEIDRAALRNDDRRVGQLEQERAALITQLRAAAGLGGRSRRLGDQSERARKTVTARIRDTLRRLDQHHPELAEHLRASVATGVTCRYQPTRRISWRF